jgi:hypothetical protein
MESSFSVVRVFVRAVRQGNGFSWRTTLRDGEFVTRIWPKEQAGWTTPREAVVAGKLFMQMLKKT